MTVTTLRPSGTDSTGGSSSVTGAATYHAAVVDDADASYFSIGAATGGWVYVTTPDVALPAAAIIKRIDVRHRTRRVGSGTARTIIQAARSGSYVSITGPVEVNVNWPSFTTSTHLMIAPAELPVANSLSGVVFATSCIWDVDPQIDVAELYVDVVYVAQPVVDVTAPVTPIEDTNRPTVVWQNTLDADGGAQAFYEVKLFTDAQYGAGGFDPDTSPATDGSGIAAGSTTTWQGAVLLADDTYRAYVRVAQTVNGAQHWSDWDFIEFALAVDLPAVPDMTLTADDGDARILIDVDANTGDATTDYLEVQRSYDGGTTWAPVRLTTETAGLVAGTSATVFDYEAPEGVTVSYRARATHDYSGVLAYSDWLTGTVASWSSTTAWLKHPLRPGLNVAVIVKEMAETQRPARQGVFQPLGASLPIIVSDTRTGAAGVVTFRTDTSAARDALDVLLDLPVTLLLQLPAADGEPDRYVILGDHSRARIGGLRSNAPYRLETVQWREVAAPDGAVDAWPAGGALESDTLLESDMFLDEIGVV